MFPKTLIPECAAMDDVKLDFVSFAGLILLLGVIFSWMFDGLWLEGMGDIA